jgi:L-aspartate oxidase
VGLFRDADGLGDAVATLDDGWSRVIGTIDHHPEDLTPDDWHAASLVTVGRLIARAALRREESRGGHYRTDFPSRDDATWGRRVSEARS